MFDIIITTTSNINRETYNIKVKENFPFALIQESNCIDTKENSFILIMEYSMINMFPEINHRNIIYIKNFYDYENKLSICQSLGEALDYAEKLKKKIFIVTSVQLYQEISMKYRDKVDNIHMFQTKPEYESYQFVYFFISNHVLMNKLEHENFTYYMFNAKHTSENSYLQLLENVYSKGTEVIGRNGKTFSLFGKTIEFDLRNGFPLLTTKKMFFRGIVEELLFFIRGDTNSKLLENKDIHIWKGNTNRSFLDSINKHHRKEGVMGPMYGYQWRYFNAEYDEEKAEPINRKNGLDQLANVIETIRKDPHSRRILLTDYNPLQANDGVLFPCHSIILQFYVNDGYLDMFCYNRSSDLFHGLPFNIASSSLLLILIAKITGLVPRNFILSLGDCHIYEQHLEVVKKQLERIPFHFPELEIEKEVKEISDIESLKYSDFILKNYKSYSVLKADMVA